MLKTPALISSPIAAAILLLPLGAAIAKATPLPQFSETADDLPALTHNEQGQQYLEESVQREMIFRRALEQQTGAAQFGDLTPEEWAYQALDDLVRRYDCLKGYPDGTYRGDRSMTRYELAAALNACLQSVERILSRSTEDLVSQEDWAAVQALQEEFAAEFIALKNRVDALEARIAGLESYQFSTTTKFQGEVIFAFSDLAVDGVPRILSRGTANGVELAAITDNDDHRPVFGARGRLWTRTSFSGEDLLLMRFTSSNLPMFDDANEFSGINNPGVVSVTGETTQTFNLGNNNATFQTNNATVFYSRPISEHLDAHVFAAGGIWSDFVPTLNPYFEDYDNGNGALTLFATHNPIYRIGGGAGAGVNWDLSDNIGLSLGYLSGSAHLPSRGGLFSGDYAMLAQADIELDDRLALGLTYNHGYHPSGTAIFEMGGLGSQGVVGSAIANVAASGSTVPKITNAYGVEVAWQPSDAIALSGFFTFVDAHIPAVRSGDYEIWTYGLGIAFPDLLTDGGLLGIFAGTQPYVAGVETDAFSYRNTVIPRHLELFYRYPLNQHISITPGIIFLSSPNQIKDGASILTLRTTFSF
ncbi:MAG: iron uptake porin [Spirulinaceae cyanobacterium]